MSQSIEYCLSVTPKPYESALTLEDISLEEMKSWAATEENYAEAVAKHAAWKEARAACELGDKLRATVRSDVVRDTMLRKNMNDE